MSQRVGAITICLSLAALGVSTWSVISQRGIAQEQAQLSAYESGLRQAEAVQFIGEFGRERSEVVAHFYIENLNTLPVVHDAAVWPYGGGRHYTVLDPCTELPLEITLRRSADFSRYIRTATLFYTAPDGSRWARPLNGVPRPIHRLPRYPFQPLSLRSIPGCHPT